MLMTESLKHACLVIEKSAPLSGQVPLAGAKNAVLVIMASLLLTSGKSKLYNVPASDDVYQMASLLKALGASVQFDVQSSTLYVDTTKVDCCVGLPEIMKKMRASILIAGPLLSKFGKAEVAVPGGCVLGTRPIDFHLKAFARMGATIECTGEKIIVHAKRLISAHIVLEYPSVGATENILMAAALTEGKTYIVNAALEPEVLDLIAVLSKMGANIKINAPATVEVEGVTELKPIEHTVIADRLETGSLILAAAITGGSLCLPTAPASALDVFLEKLEEMGHAVTIGKNGEGIDFKATACPKAVSFKTMPYPGFPTDLQAPMMAVLSLADGISVINETVYENRFQHVRELEKMGACITVEGSVAVVKGVKNLIGARVVATDIRASAALVAAGLVATGTTIMTGLSHLTRGYQDFEKKLSLLGARIRYENVSAYMAINDINSDINKDASVLQTSVSGSAI